MRQPEPVAQGATPPRNRETVNKTDSFKERQNEGLFTLFRSQLLTSILGSLYKNSGRDQVLLKVSVEFEPIMPRLHLDVPSISPPWLDIRTELPNEIIST